jgi:hypothetical protein
VASLLLEHGVDPDAPCEWPPDAGYAETGAPLLLAVANEHWEAAHLLLDHGASANAPPIDSGWSPADIALQSIHRGSDERMREVANRIFLGGGRPQLTALIAAKEYVALNEILDRAPADDPPEPRDEVLGYRRGRDVFEVTAGALYWVI